MYGSILMTLAERFTRRFAFYHIFGFQIGHQNNENFDANVPNLMRCNF